MKYKVFIDGQEGTTGLRIRERFDGREDIELLTIDEDLRKDKAERKRLINASDFTFLCLPDEAAREAVSLVESDRVKIIDASTAHRTSPQWAYGLPELSARHRSHIANSGRVAVPGCYASGFAALVFPLVEAGAIMPDFPLHVHAVSGYSGAGKAAIAEYEGGARPEGFSSPRAYALGQSHKHLPEMQAVCGLDYPPMFSPMVDDYYAGMLVSVPIMTRLLPKPLLPQDIRAVYRRHYAGQNFITLAEEDGFIAANTLAGYDDMELFVTGNKDRILLTARFDNLGKGASGAAVQCMNIMMGLGEAEGLKLYHKN